MVEKETFDNRFSDEYEGTSAALQRQPQDADYQMTDEQKKTEADLEQQDGNQDRLADYFAIVGISPDLKQLQSELTECESFTKSVDVS